MPIQVEELIRAAARAMREVVLPGIDPSNATAVDQGTIVLGTLELLAERVLWLYEYEVAELTEFHALGLALLEVADQPALGADEAIERCRAAVDGVGDPSRTTAPYVDLRATVIDLKAAVDELVIHLLNESAAAAATAGLVLAQSRQQITRERVWNRRAGFDSRADSLPSLVELLGTR